jgi:KDO2-lipid IV(A) lauroyltransferase
LATVARVVPLLPLRAIPMTATMLSWVAYHLLAHDRKVALANLGVAFGDTMPRWHKRRLARRAFRNFAEAALGLFWAPRVTPELIDRFVDIQGLEHVRSAQAAGRGVVICSSHYGNWELGTLVLGFKGVPLMMVTEPTRNPAIERKITQLRSISGHKAVHPRFALIKLFKAISRGEVVGMLIDVNGRRGRGGVWLDFFGLPVFNSHAIAEMALRANAAVFFVWGEPLPRGRWRMFISPEIRQEPTGDRDADVKSLSQKCLDQSERLVRQHPELWLWTYKRWKRRPSEEKGRYPFYSKYDPNT